MGDNKKWTRRAAVGSLASGGGLLLFGTGGSTQITSNRDVEVNSGNGEDAVLQFVDVSDGAGVVNLTDRKEVYRIKDRAGKFSLGDISASGTTGSGGNSVPIEVVKDETNGSFSVKAACPGKLRTTNDDLLKLSFILDNGEQTITATRTTDNKVSFDCGYSDSANYRDNSGNTDNSDIPPRDNAKGEVSNPERLNQKNEQCNEQSNEQCKYATLKTESRGSGSDKKGAEIGFALPPVQESRQYVLNVSVSDKQPGGDWVVDIVDSEGNSLTRIGTGNKDKLMSGSNSFNFELNKENIDPSEQIELYLIFKTTSKGNNKTAEVDYFELKPV